MTRKQRAYAASYLPLHFKVLHFVEHAYCIAKVGELSATCVVTPGLSGGQTAITVSGVFELIRNPNIGEWVSLVYGSGDTSMRWFCLPHMGSML